MANHELNLPSTETPLACDQTPELRTLNLGPQPVLAETAGDVDVSGG